jgi:hypothetical protein
MMTLPSPSASLKAPLTWQNSTLLDGDLAARVAKLKSEDGKYLLAIGSTGLVQSLLTHDLVDESAASWSNSGQAFQILDQPDHRQRIPVTVVEQVSPDSVSFVLPNLVHDEEEPGDFNASLGVNLETRPSQSSRCEKVFESSLWTE